MAVAADWPPLEWGIRRNMTRVVRPWALSSILDFLILALLLWLLAMGTLSVGPRMIVVAAAIAASAFAGVVIGYLLSRRLWLRCRETGIFRRRPRQWLLLIPLLGYLVFVQLPIHGFVATTILIPVCFGGIAALGTVALGIVLFERVSECHLWFGPVPPGRKAEWIEFHAVSPRNVAAR